MRIFRLVLVLAALWYGGLPRAACAAPVPTTNRLVLASWNVENLFDPYEDAANPGSKDFTPGGWARWTPQRYAQKLEHLAEVIAAMQPDILCLTEVENRRVLEDLVRTLHEKQACDLPVILHREGGDHRGIDVAMLARYAPAATNWIAPVPEQRDILVARFVVGGRPLTVVLNHWKSWVGDAAENVRIRTRKAKASRGEVERRLAAEPAAAVVATGDFNDNADSAILTNAAGYVLWKAPTARGDGVAGVLHNLSGLLPPEKRGTYYYARNQVWNSFDSISVSRGMLAGAPHPAPWRVQPDSYAVFSLPAQRDADGHPLPFHRVRSRALGDVYLTGYSDHFPVRVVLVAAP